MAVTTSERSIHVLEDLMTLSDKIITFLSFTNNMYSKTCRQRPLSSETTSHERLQFRCTNSFSYIFDLVVPKATFSWPPVHVLPVNKDHFN